MLFCLGVVRQSSYRQWVGATQHDIEVTRLSAMVRGVELPTELSSVALTWHVARRHESWRRVKRHGVQLGAELRNPRYPHLCFTFTFPFTFLLSPRYRPSSLPSSILPPGVTSSNLHHLHPAPPPPPGASSARLHVRPGGEHRLLPSKSSGGLRAAGHRRRGQPGANPRHRREGAPAHRLCRPVVCQGIFFLFYIM